MGRLRVPELERTTKITSTSSVGASSGRKETAADLGSSTLAAQEGKILHILFGPLASAGEQRLEVLDHERVERRALGPVTLVGRARLPREKGPELTPRGRR
jgi:hypothetical protein